MEYAIYQHGIFEVTRKDMTWSLRYIAKKMGKYLAGVTVKEAINAGWSIRVIR